MANWYYDDAGGTLGPYSPEEMRFRVEGGAIRVGTRVRREDGQWFLAENIPGLLDPPDERAQLPDEGDSTGGLIPYKNAPALIAYYLGIFSIIPCAGIFLGITAVVLGIKGLRYQKEIPAVKGQVHAWIGIVSGGFFAFLWIVALAVGIIVAVAEA